MNIAIVLQQQGELQQALDKYHEALPVLEKTLGRNHPDLAATYSNIGVVFRQQAKYPEALDMYRKALEVDEKVHSPDHLSVADTKNKRAGVFFMVCVDD